MTGVSLGWLAQGSAAGSEGEQHAAAVKTRISAVAENLLRNKVDTFPSHRIGKLIGTSGILFRSESRRYEMIEPFRENSPSVDSSD
jgi:hypothetical protein